jgi:hypothetical protein
MSRDTRFLLATLVGGVVVAAFGVWCWGLIIGWWSL